MTPSSIALDAIADALFAASGDARTGRAGGTYVLWARLPDGRVLLIGSPQGPWCPDRNGAVTAAEFILVSWPTVADYLDGAEPVATRRCAFTLDALAAELRIICRPSR